jgi:predicted transcriptional regulator
MMPIKSQQEKISTPNIKRTRCQVAIDIMKLIATTYPTKWTANDMAIQLNVNARTINRILTDMVQTGLFERKYNSYTISLSVMQQFYGARWAYDQEVNKITMLQTQKINRRGKSNGKDQK